MPTELLSLAKSINAEHRKAVAGMANALVHAMDCGDLLNKAKTQCKHGEWSGWLTANFEGSQRTAQEYIKAAGERVAIEKAIKGNCELSLRGWQKLSTPKQDTPRLVPKAQRAALLDSSTNGEHSAIFSDDIDEKLRKAKATDAQREAFAEYEEESQEELIDSVLAGRQTLPQAIETGEVPEPTADEIMQERNSWIERFCRSLQKTFDDEAPTDEWLEYRGLIRSAESHLKACCKTLRLAKCKHLCPMCDGDGCDKCLGTGRVPHSQYQQLV